jgi:Ca2+-binding RTX toxin-like protein
MRVRFLASGLAFFATVTVLAAVPVLAQGSTPAPCTITGTSAGELLAGTSGSDVICGNGGADTITAKGENDIVRGGYGADVIYRDIGRDYLYDGRGHDRARIDTPLDIFSSIESH